MCPEEFAYIGKSVPKIDARDKATGRSRYVQDILLPGMLYAKIKRSSVPSAKIKAIDASRARSLAGVKAVLTGKDIPDLVFGFGADRRALQKDVVRCEGDEIAAVAAVNEAAASAAIELIDVQYEETPAVFDPRAAIDSPVLVHGGKKSNVFKEYNYSHGEVNSALSGCAAVADGNYTYPYQAHCCMSPSGVVADWNASGRLTLYTPTQVPFLIQRDIAAATGISPADVRIIQPVIGGGFGSRLDLYPYEVICALLAKVTGRPVKILFDRNEEFTMDPYRPKTYVDMKTGADNSGRIIACDVSVVVDNGAYVSWGSVTPVVMMHTIGCMYNIESVRYNAKAVYTNNPHTGAFLGFGNPELIFALETQIDSIARQLGIDPVELRLRNANKTGDKTAQGSVITSCAFEQCIREARDRIGWGEKRRCHDGPKQCLKRGVGLAAVFHVGGGARIYRSDGCGAIVQLDDFGRVVVATGSTDIGQGSETVIAQIVAEELGVPLDAIIVQNSDTQLRVWDVGVHASRTTFIAGNAARLAAKEAKEKLLASAARQLGCAPEGLKIAGGIISTAADPAKCIRYDKVLRGEHFRQGGGVIMGSAFYDPPTEMADKANKGNISAAYAFGAQAAEVEVDIETGKVRVLKVVAVHDVGRAINKMHVEAQIEGGVMQGLGYALTEEVLVRDGRVMNPNFLDYRLPGPRDLPEIECVIIESNDPEGPFGAKGIGEPPIVPTAAAVANAIYNAAGVKMTELPMTPERVLTAINDPIIR